MGYQCFHCLSDGVVWDGDFSYDDYGYDGDGIVHVLHCTECGSEIEYRVPTDEEGEDDDGSGD